eukprot:6827226-Pyramimonas_sp.AAC.1
MEVSQPSETSPGASGTGSAPRTVDRPPLPRGLPPGWSPPAHQLGPAMAMVPPTLEQQQAAAALAAAAAGIPVPPGPVTGPSAQ